VTRVDPHVNYSPDWRTPPAWIEWARATMGGIDLDPCASPLQHEQFARKNYDGETFDGLMERWRGRVYCNPPGANSSKSVKAWWTKAHSRRLAALTWAFFNCEAIKSVAPSPLDLPGYLVIPMRRVRWWQHGAESKRPRNWSWFWTTREPAPTPIECRIIETGRRITGVMRSIPELP